MIKQFFVLVTLGILGLSVITGCSKREEDVKDKEKVLIYTNLGHKDYNDFREKEAKKFEKLHPKVLVKYRPVEGGPTYWDKMITQIAGGTVPDIFCNIDIISLAKKGALLDLTPYIEKDKDYFSQIYPELIEFHRYNGKIYGLPSNLNIDVLFYNKRLFDKDGLVSPDKSWTWDTMLEGAKKLTKRDTKRITTQFGIVGLRPLTLFRQGGGKIWNDNENRCIINLPQNAEALQFYKDLIDKFHVSPTGPEVREQGYWDMFLAERAGMIYGGRWLTALLKLKKELTWGITLPPVNKNRDSWASFNTLSISSNTKYPELAYELVKFLIRPEGIQFLVDFGDSMPIRWSREENEYFLNDPERPKGENQVYLDTMNHAYTERWLYSEDITYQMQANIINQEIERFLYTEEVTTEKCLQNILGKLDALLKIE